MVNSRSYVQIGATVLSTTLLIFQSATIVGQSSSQKLQVTVISSRQSTGESNKSFIEVVDSVKSKKPGKNILVEKKSGVVCGIYLIIRLEKGTKKLGNSQKKKVEFKNGTLDPYFLKYQSNDELEFSNSGEDILAPTGFNSSIGPGQRLKFAMPRENSSLFPSAIYNHAASKESRKTIGFRFCTDSAIVLQTDKNGMAKFDELPEGDHTLFLWHPGSSSRLKFGVTGANITLTKRRSSVKFNHKGQSVSLKIDLQLNDK